MIPAVVFREPPHLKAAAEMSTTEYVDAVVATLCEAAKVGLTDPIWLTRPGKTPLSLSERSGAREVLRQLVESDRNVRAWMAVEHLSDEINYVVTCIRKMMAADERIAGTHHLASLQARVSEFTTLQQQGIASRDGGAQQG